ncbi:hypothetical protein AB0K68_50110, partial [Streptomyces sp. NPDC050698]
MKKTELTPIGCIHRWEVESRHRTSEGMVTYLRCHCGSWQTLLTEWMSGGAASVSMMVNPIPDLSNSGFVVNNGCLA